MTAGCPSPAYVPRSGSGSPGCLRVSPRTWASYRIVLRHGVSSGRSPPQSNAVSTTTLLGTPAALSR